MFSLVFSKFLAMRNLTLYSVCTLKCLNFYKTDKCFELFQLLLEISKRGYGQTGSKAHLPASFQFSTEFIEIFRKCFSFQGSLNDAIKSDLTLLYSAHFALGSTHIALFFHLFWLKFFSFWKNSAKCVLCNAKYALCSGVRSDLIAPFKRPPKKNHLLKISI